MTYRQVAGIPLRTSMAPSFILRYFITRQSSRCTSDGSDERCERCAVRCCRMVRSSRVRSDGAFVHAALYLVGGAAGKRREWLLG